MKSRLKVILTCLFCFLLLYLPSVSLAFNVNEVAKALKQESYSSLERKIGRYLIGHSSYFDLKYLSEDEFLKNVVYSALSREVMPWGGKIPERVFLNYVAPLRISQEPLRPWRSAFFELFAPLVVDCKSMRDAALKINKWLSKRVKYSPTDPRDLDPISILKRGFGRCEEVNVLYIAALRSVGIPARNVWVPAWRHTRGNHAWVEVYLDDNKWHYIDPSWLNYDFDSAWFTPYLETVPVVLTFSFDDECREYKTSKKDRVCVITERYARTVKLTVKVERFVHARVYIAIINGGLLRPILAKKSGSDNVVRFYLVPGDYVIIVSDTNNQVLYRFVELKKDTTLKFVAPSEAFSSGKVVFCSRRASILNKQPVISKSLQRERFKIKKEHDRRINVLEKIVDTWMPNASSRIRKKLVRTGARLFEIMGFYETLSSQQKTLFLKFIDKLNSKDLVDISESEIINHLKFYSSFAASEVFANLFLNPRISYEPPRWNYLKLRKFLSKNKESDFFQIAREIHDIVKSVRLSDDSLLCGWLSPLEVLSYMQAPGEKNVKVTEVALFRAAGIPALYVEYADKVLLFDGAKWLEFEERSDKGVDLKEVQLSTLRLSFKTYEDECLGAGNYDYYNNFVFYRWDNGQVKVVNNLSYKYNNKSCTYEFSVIPGRYDLVFEKSRSNDRVCSTVVPLTLNGEELEELSFMVFN